MTALRIGQTRVHAHKLVYETAQEMARALYGDLMRNNVAYAGWKKACESFGDDISNPLVLERRFLEEVVPHLIEQARATLAEMLGQPINEGLKKSIYDALLKDAPFRAGRLKAQGRLK